MKERLWMLSGFALCGAVAKFSPPAADNFAGVVLAIAAVAAAYLAREAS